MTDLHLGEHISQRFNQDLEAIRTAVLEMGGIVEKQVSDAVRSLVEANSQIAHQVLVTEDLVDQKEKFIDEECTKILARRQPAASDLRLVLAVSKIILDLERVGDEAPMNDVVASSHLHASWTRLIAMHVFAASDARHIDRPHILAAGCRLLLREEHAPAVETATSFGARGLPR